MKRILIILSLILAFMAKTSAQEIRRLGNTWNLPKKEEPQPVRTPGVTTTTTSSSIKRDTIVIQEIIKRTDVVHRTEEVVKRVETAPYDNSNLFRNNLDIMNLVDLELEEETPATAPVVVEEGSAFPEVTPPDGNYIWVPDSMQTLVMRLLRGQQVPLPQQRQTNQSPDEVDRNEMVTFRGRKMPMILKDRNLGRFDRGLFNYLFIPKGICQLGVTASYGEFSTENLEILDFVSDIDFKGKLWAVRPYFAYFIKSNMSLGLRLGYTSGEANVGAFNVDIDDDMSFNLHDIMYKSRSYSAAITYTNYLGIARQGRFGFFNEVEFAMAGGDSDFHRPFNGEMRRTHTQTYQASLNFSPGVCVYVLDQVSFNVSFGVFGLNIKHEKQKVNDEPLGERTTSGANFRFNIFNINFGIAVNI